MGPVEAIAIAAAGVGAGTINAVVGSGTLLTFPTLLAVGVPPVTANVSNNIGLVPGALSGAWGYRAELRGQAALVRRLLPASLVGGLSGAVLLLTLPAGAFEAIVPALVLVGLVLVVFQPRLAARVAGRSTDGADGAGGAGERPRDSAWVRPAVFGTGVYGGYFGAAQGVLLMGILGAGVPQDLQRSNGLKNVLAGGVNAVAGLVFALVADVDWRVVALLAVGSLLGGTLGSRVGRRLSARLLRGVIVVVGLVALAVFLLG